MKLSFRFVSLVTILFALCAFGFAHIAEHYGPPVAALAAVGLFAACMDTPRAILGAATTVPILTDERPGVLRYLPLAAATKIPSGALVAIDANGRAVNAANTAGLRVIGRAEETVDNSAGAAGDLSINVKVGEFKYANSVANAITVAMVGKRAFVEDNQTVANAGTNGVVAGRITGVDSDGVWINTRSAALNAAIVATSTDGTAGAAADLAALKVEAEKIGDDVRAVITYLNS